jgi:phosphoribosylanthranilate isomerase
MERVDRKTHVKICGITRLEDAQAAVEGGAWAIGMIFWPGSSRYCDPTDAARIARVLRRRVQLVGVFVDQPLDEVAFLVETVPLSIVQLHGDEGPSYCAEIKRRTGARVIKAARVRGRDDIQALSAFRTDLHLVDTHREGTHGGTGETFDWGLLDGRRSPVPLILSGGLHAGNVAQGIDAIHPWAVDVASGVESAPGVKDHNKLAAFLEAVRGPVSSAVPALEGTS